MKSYFGLAKLKTEGMAMSYDDIVRDIEAALERQGRNKRPLPRYILLALKAAKTEIVGLRRRGD